MGDYERVRVTMQWIETILQKHIGEGGVLDLAKAIDEVKAEAPKNVMPKDVYNQAASDLKAANALVKELKAGTADVEALQAKIADYEKDIETLNAERLAERKTYALKEKLTAAGAKDVDYMIYKLGDAETDKDGNIIELDNKIESLKEQHATMFAAEVEPPQAGQRGYTPLDTSLDDGKEPDAQAQVLADFEAALGLKPKQ